MPEEGIIAGAVEDAHGLNERALILEELRRFEGGYLEEYVQAVAQGTRNPPPVRFDEPRRAAARTPRMAQIAAGTGIHGGDEKKARGKCDGAARPPDAD